jgi:hypothetical protein
MNNRFVLPISILLILFSACTNSTDSPTQTSKSSSKIDNSELFKQPLFEATSPAETNVNFSNDLDLKKVKNLMEYVNVYNGGGMATGDINNDGLPDLYFTGNMVDNKLYLNKGNFEFEDITAKAGVACSNSWSTGVTMTDVNGDGFLDIYVCRSYHDEAGRRANQLFINNGDLTFTEKSTEYRINDTGYSITATFLDYDRDGDADLFVGNHPLNRNRLSYGKHVENWNNPSISFSDKLFRNNGDGTFTNVTEEAGILNYGWTLGCVAADLNQDGWTDIFVSVDHSEPDRYYQNNGDGTFSQLADEKFKHISFSSMGVDAGDINNDGLLDLAVVEMLSTNNFDEKTAMPPMNPERFWAFVDVGYHYQYMRNMLHLNAGEAGFSEIGQLAGTHRTDWSWTSLLADFDNDGWNDYYITNGYLRLYSHKDHYNKYYKELEKIGADPVAFKRISDEYISTAPAAKLTNNFFRNNGDLTFKEMGPEFGLNHSGFSSGSAYADLDNDGDLDLIVNHTNETASVYKNNLRERGAGNYLRVKLEHPGTICPIGTKLKIETNSGIQFREFTYTRGYQSAVEGVVHFGLGSEEKINKLTVDWLDGKSQVLTNINGNQLLSVNYENATDQSAQREETPKLFVDVTNETGLDFKHSETIFDDYAVQVLLPHKMSQLGPFFTTGDMNRDGLEDVYVGGGNGQAGALYLQTESGKFTKAEIPSFETDKNSEDMGAVFVDVNNDGWEDLYVVSGGYEHGQINEELYQDRLYINVGKNMLQKVKNALPVIRSSGSCVKPFDFDGDGDMDLFVGGRQTPRKYPSPANSILLENVKGKYQDVTAEKAPQLNALGMVTDAVWSDMNADGAVDLLIVGEWMPLTVFKQVNGKFENATSEYGLVNTGGWWNTIAEGDIDNDGDKDFIIGNLGTNYKYQASAEKPFHIYANDFDESGTFDIALGYFLENDVLYPVRGRQCSSEQMPSLAEKFPTYDDFGKASIFEVYGEDNLEASLHYEAHTYKSSILLNKGNGQYEIKPLKNEAQISPINGIVLNDFDQDGNLDLLVGGNLHVSEVETGRADAGRGLFMKGNGDGTFEYYLPYETGLNLDGDVKDIQLVNTGIDGEQLILVGNNNSDVKIVKWNNKGAGTLSSLQ